MKQECGHAGEEGLQDGKEEAGPPGLAHHRGPVPAPGCRARLPALGPGLGPVPKEAAPTPASTPPSLPAIRRYHTALGVVYETGPWFLELDEGRVLQIPVPQPSSSRPGEWDVVEKKGPGGEMMLTVPEEVQAWVIHDFLEAINHVQRAVRMTELRSPEHLRPLLTGKWLHDLMEARLWCTTVSSPPASIRVWVHYCRSAGECVVGVEFDAPSERRCYDEESRFSGHVFQDPPIIGYLLMVHQEGRWKLAETLAEYEREVSR